MNVHRTALLFSVPLLATLCLPLTGCYGNPEAFAKNASKPFCKRVRECDRSLFEEEYGGDLDRCEDETYTDFLDYNDLLEDIGCDYDPGDGRHCGATIRSLKNDCSRDADQEITDACGALLEEIYDCPRALELDPSELPVSPFAGGLATTPAP